MPSSLRKKYEQFNDDMWLDAKCDEAYYSGKMAGCGEIDNIFDEDLLDKEFIKRLDDGKHTAEANRDAGCDGEEYAYYDGVVAAYRELLTEMGEEEDE